MFAFYGDPLKFVDALPWLCATVFAMGLMIAAMFVLRFLRFWKLDEPESEESLRNKFREMHREEELTAEEYREVQLRLAEQMIAEAEKEAEKRR